MPTPPILLGESDFEVMRREGGLYVDKTGFISSVLQTGAKVQLYPRPRRFGKTLNLSTLHYFLEVGADRTALFEGLKVWEAPEARKHFQRYPVIYLSFKDIKHFTWKEAVGGLQRVLAEEIRRHPELAASAVVPASLQRRLQELEDERGDASGGLQQLSEALFLHHKQPVAILMDEYDAPLLIAREKGYYNEAVSWFRSFLSGGLKDQKKLFKGVLTGVLRVAQESLFSELNNVSVFSLLHPRTGAHFGFTEPEVMGLLAQFERREEAPEVRRWYNGYQFGTHTIYNPWSILNFLSNPEMGCQPWWLNTSANTLVREILLQNSDLHTEFVSLLLGGRVEKEIHEHTTLRDLTLRDLWSLLLFSGYLRADAVRSDEWGQLHASLSLPNQEVRLLWRNTFLQWLESTAVHVEPLHRALLTGDALRVEQILSEMLLRHVSSHDVKQTQDEVFYHAFVLGLLVSLEKTHAVRSNREVGSGRADVLITPKQPGLPGVVLEFKRQVPKRSLKSAAEAALKQIGDQSYTTDLKAQGASPIHRLGIAFSGKEVAVRGDSLPE